jgi:GDP/UDP-N,N'-diacetylbacillosamine 2-epimerase (hydrolysing)
VAGDTHSAMAKSIGLVTQSFVDVLMARKPDWVVLAGDRAEQLGAAIASTFMYIPTAHIQAGERSGNIDGVTRHAISKLVHLHFSSNPDASTRLKKMGEEEFRIIESGAPQLDSLIHDARPNKAELIARNLIPNSNYALICFHPVTEDYENLGSQIVFMINSCKSIELPKVWILPNNDAGGDLIRESILSQKTSTDKIFSNLPREVYTSIMENAQFLFGNSSSGILEAASLNLPVINIGRRQANRLSAINVVNVDYDETEVQSAIRKVQSPAFREIAREAINPYGDGMASARILTALQVANTSREFLVKSIAY